MGREITLIYSLKVRIGEQIMKNSRVVAIGGTLSYILREKLEFKPVFFLFYLFIFYCELKCKATRSLPEFMSSGLGPESSGPGWLVPGSPQAVLLHLPFSAGRSQPSSLNDSLGQIMVIYYASFASSNLCKPRDIPALPQYFS